ncbi:MAG: response regulator [Rhodoferax sp.]|nr:response regulator [Rhodoferax sp.]
MPPSVSKPRILVVEDEAIVARDIQLQLVELGYEAVGHAARGDEAVELAGALRPNLVLMDIQLSGEMDGIAAAQIMRTQFGLPVVFLTAFAADDTLERAKLTEPYGYILKPFSERELRTVLTMALYKHKVEAQLREKTLQLQTLSRRVLEAQETERRRVAHELHDELGQALTAIKINLQTRGRFHNVSTDALDAENIRILDDALQQVRRLALALRPSMLDDLGLGPALRWLGEQTAARSGFEVTMNIPVLEPRLPPDMETACFRIVQEALTNITRHADAKHVTIDLQREEAAMVLSVQDDGSGFDLDAARARAIHGGSLGVLGMQERAMLVGGQLDITSAPGQGSQLRLRCALRRQGETL